MDGFYRMVIERLVKEQELKKDATILVCCGGTTDADVLRELGFENVTISNLDTRLRGDEFNPYAWSFQDAESTTFADGEFDFVVVHNGLHHCYSPHRAIIEMYRVARRGIILFEPYDNWVTRLGVRLNVGQEYEHAAVYYNDMQFGGVRNSAIPNYVYRVTRREIEKTIRCGNPCLRPAFRFFHQIRIPWGQLRGRRNPVYLAAVYASLPFLKLLTWLFPTQANCFAAVVIKPELPAGLHPWLKVDGSGAIVPNREWLENRYRALPVEDLNRTG
jgi:SAM-dependent methyltransferase